MEFIKNLPIIICFLLATVVHGQTQQQLQEVFSASYTLEAEKKYSEAILQLTSVYSETSYELNLRLGWLLYLNTDYAKSVSYYQKCIKLMPVATEPLWRIIEPYTAQNDLVKVEITYKNIIKLDPKNSLAHYWLGVIFYNRKNFTSAKQYFDVSLNLHPFDYDALLMSAWTNYFLGNSIESRVLFNKVLLYNPNDKSALEGLSLIK